MPSGPRHLVAVTTTKPASSLTPGGGGGALILFDPSTGCVLSSLRAAADVSGKSGLGISSLSPFPPHFAATATASFSGSGHNNSGGGSHHIRPALAFGGNSTKKGDTYAMLLNLRPGSSPPLLQWKCRLPEPDLHQGGLNVSPCGHYAIGGGASGSCYVWSTTSGKLLRTWKAHYRQVTAMAWTDKGRFLVTGGADGMVHIFSLMDLVIIDGVGGSNRISNNNNNNNNSSRTGDSSRTVPPLCTFSVHHFPVTSLVPLDGDRVASASEDGQVVVMEVFSEQVALNLQLPHGIKCLAYHGVGRIFAGSIRGTIYSIDMNAYAMRQTEKQGANVAKKRRQEWQRNGVNMENANLGEMVFGTPNSTEAPDDTTTYQTDWIGHNHPVTSLALLTQGQPQLLISGDTLGQVRIWDLESRTCLKVLHPWSHSGIAGSTSTNSNGDKSPSKKNNGNPVTSIEIIPQPDDSTLSGSMIFRSPNSSVGGGRNHNSISTLIPPLNKYSSMNETSGETSDNVSATAVQVAFLKPNNTMEHASYWEARPIVRKRRRQPYLQSRDETQQASQAPNNDVVEQPMEVSQPEDNDEKQQQLDIMREEMESLRAQLREKQTAIERWETVNNKLMQRLKAKN